MNEHSHEAIEDWLVVAVVVAVAAFLMALVGGGTTAGQGDRDARRIDRIERQLNIPGPDVPTPDILIELHALQTEVAK